MNKKRVTLVLTHNCNLACTYCYEHCKDFGVMSAETAKGILANELNADNNFDFIEIDLFGGEPFLAFGTMKHIVSFLRCGTFRKQWSLSTITNGTVITEEMQLWLRENSDVIESVLSYDGTPAMQDANRGSGSAARIDTGFFRECFPNAPVKMTVSSETLSHLAEGTIYLHKDGFLVNNSLANGIDWSDAFLLDELGKQLMLLVHYYLENPDVPECGMLQFPYEELYTAASAEVIYRTCDACAKMTCYDADGKAYPCQQFLPISTGPLRAAEVPTIEFPPEKVPIHLLEEDCRQCPINSVCQFCYGDNWLKRGSIFARDCHMCSMQKVLFKAKAFLAAEKWSQGLLKITPEQEKMLLEAIQVVSALG